MRAAKKEKREKKAKKAKRKLKVTKKAPTTKVKRWRKKMSKKVTLKKEVKRRGRPRIEKKVEAPVKRKPGRPKKEEQKKLKSEPAPAPVKRGPGRPPKAAAQKVDTKTKTKTVAKASTPGRPKKVTAEVVKETPKRKPGRPKKVTAEVVKETPKRKPGRPKKAAEAPKGPTDKMIKKAFKKLEKELTSPEMAEALKADLPEVKKSEKVEEIKRKPGRPKKVTEEVVEAPKRKPGRPPKKRSPGRPPKATKKHKQNMKKTKTKVQPKKALSRDKYNAANISKSEYVAIKPWCEEHGLTVRMFMAQLEKFSCETYKVKGKSTKNQVALGVYLADAEAITKEIQKTLQPMAENEMTLADVAAELKISIAAARSRIHTAGIKGRRGRCPQTDKNPARRNQITMIYKKEAVAVLKKKEKVITIA